MGNYIGVDDPPNNMYGKVMSLPDDLIMDYFELVTDVPDKELSVFRKQLATNSINPMQLKKRLAFEIVKDFYNETSANDAENYFTNIFQKKVVPDKLEDAVLSFDFARNMATKVDQQTKKNEPGLELSVKEKPDSKWYPVGMLSVRTETKKESSNKIDDSQIGETRNTQSSNADGALITFEPNIPEELRIRGGLPNLFAKLNKRDTVRIAYLGGTISEANGWRSYSFDWFKAQFPKVHFIEINAAIAETGSDFAACRLSHDVLAKEPDLVFMEHRIDGGGGFEAQSDPESRHSVVTNE